MITANNEFIREQIITLSLQQQNKQYQHNTYGNDTFDCAGLVWFVYNEITNIDIFNQGYGMSTTTKIMTSKYGKLTLFNENLLHKDLHLIKEGDILFFHRQSLKDTMPKEFNKYPGHCGIYLGEQNFIHASRPKQKVIISNFNEDEYWLKVLVGFKNIIDYNEQSENKILYKKTR